MSVYDRQLQPPSPHEPMSDREGKPSQQHMLHQQRMWEWVAAGFVVIPCSVSGTANAIVLTPLKRPDRGASGYSTLLPFLFVAAADSTGAVTIQVRRDSQFSLAALPAYKGATAAAIGAGDIKAGVPYFAIHCDAVTSPALPERMVLK